MGQLDQKKALIKVKNECFMNKAEQNNGEHTHQ